MVVGGGADPRPQSNVPCLPGVKAALVLKPGWVGGFLLRTGHLLFSDIFVGLDVWLVN